MLNESPSVTNYEGYEFISSTFAPVKLPVRVSVFYDGIFGPDATAESKSLFLRKILICCETNKVLKAYVKHFDKRITYKLPFSNVISTRKIGDVTLDEEYTNLFKGSEFGKQLYLTFISGPTYIERVSAAAMGLADTIHRYRVTLGI